MVIYIATAQPEQKAGNKTHYIKVAEIFFQEIKNYYWVRVVGCLRERSHSLCSERFEIIALHHVIHHAVLLMSLNGVIMLLVYDHHFLIANIKLTFRRMESIANCNTPGFLFLFGRRTT